MRDYSSPLDVPAKHYRTDTLTDYQKAKMLASLPIFKAVVFTFTLIVSLVFPLAFPLLMMVSLWVALQSHRDAFPARAPVESEFVDKNDPKPGGKGFHKARGQVYLGNHRGTKKEVWLSFSDLLTHIYALGATGSGKTEAIWAIYTNFLAAGSGFTLGDGKGTIDFIRQGGVLTRRFGIEDDYFAINYASDQTNTADLSYGATTNNINPFSEGSAANLKELFASLSLSGDAGQNQYFEDNAAVIIERTFPALVELRDKKILDLNIGEIGRAFPLDNIYSLANHPEISLESKEYIHDYLKTISFDFKKADKSESQPEEVGRMHSQFISHFNKVVASLTVQYKDIYMVDQGEVSMKDVTSNRRILVFTLPSLEKSGAELKTLGKILITSQKNAVSIGLGSQLEGTREDAIDGLPSSHITPYGLGYDEWAFYSIPDMALLPAQIRGLFFSAGFFAQDYAGTTGAGEKDAEQIFANTRVKLFGAIEDVGQTWEKFRSLIGEVRQVVNTRYKYIPGMFGGRSIRDKDSSEVTHRAAVEIQQMQAQVEGEFYLAMRGRLSPISFFYTGLKELDEKLQNPYRIIRLMRTYAPSDEEIARIRVQEQFLKILFSDHQLFTNAGSVSRVSKILAEDNSRSNQKYLKALKYFSDEELVSLKPSSREEPVATIEQVEREPTPQKPEFEALVVDPEEKIEITAESDTTQGIMDSFGLAGNESSDDSILLSKNRDKIVSNAQDSDIMRDQVAPYLSKSSDSSANPDEKLRADLAVDPIYNETVANKEFVSEPSQFATILSEAESQRIFDHSVEMNSLLGVADESAQALAESTISRLSTVSYYIVPPAPEAPKKGEVQALSEKLDDLLS